MSRHEVSINVLGLNLPKSTNPDKGKTTRDNSEVRKEKTHPLLLGDDADDLLLGLGIEEAGGGDIGGGRVGLRFVGGSGAGAGAGAGGASSVFRPRCQNIGMLLLFGFDELDEDSAACGTGSCDALAEALGCLDFGWREVVALPPKNSEIPDFVLIRVPGVLDIVNARNSRGASKGNSNPKE